MSERLHQHALSQNLSTGVQQTQQLMASPKMQQALAILQMPLPELCTKVELELERNPLLSTDGIEAEEEGDIQMEALLAETEAIVEDGDTPVDRSLGFRDEDYEIFRRLDEEFRDHFLEGGGAWRRTSDEEHSQLSYQESQVVAENTLFEALMQQAHETFEDDSQLAMAEAIIGNLDDNGFLTTPLEEIASWGGFEEAGLRSVLASIQTFTPSGVGAADVREALLIQLQHQNKWDSLAYQVVDECYSDLMHNRLPTIASWLGVSPREVREAIDRDLSRLTLYPGHLHARDLTQPIVPDLIFSDDGEELRFEVNGDDLPNLRLNRTYLDMLEEPSIAKETRTYILRRLSGAKWLIHNIDARSRTLRNIADVLVRWQGGFLRSIEGKLRPMTMRAVADEIGVSESTVARAVAGKYLSCPRGTFAMRALFQPGYDTEHGEKVSSGTVKDTLERIVDAEDKTQPFTDEQLVKELSDRGIECARRTVAKYRHELGYGTSLQRRRY